MNLKNLSKVLWAFFALVLSISVSAQSTHVTHLCGFNHVNKDLPRHEGIVVKRNQLNIQKMIPTIVHVLHNGEPYGANAHIESGIVYEAIDSLNSRMAQTNANLEFCISSIGPDGNPLTGIVYHNLTTEFPDYEFSNNAQDYYGFIQANTLISPNEYLNIYVDSWSSGPLGFATLPSGHTCWVRTNQFSDPESKTLIHEVGHWCGLYHTFNDSFNAYDDCEDAATETNCETQGDRVCDTPPTAINFGCTQLCPDEVIESYMSYASDACQTLFTPGQIDRMHAQLEAFRPGVINNNVACGNADIDLAVIGFTNNNTECNTYVNPSVTIKNLGLSGDFIVDCTIEITNESDAVVYSNEYISSVSLGQNEIFEISFDPFTFQFGDYVVDVNLNTLDDGWEYNNSLTQELPLQPFTEINVTYYDAFTPNVQFRIYEWDPETGDHIPGVVASCNWGGVQCWEYTFFQEEDWPIEWSYCLQPGCYELWWRWTANSNLDCELVEILGYENCYLDVSLSNGSQIYYADSFIDGDSIPSILYFNFCVEEPDPCPITECPTDLDGDGITGNTDLLMFLPLVGDEGECVEGDFNFDGQVTFLDLALFLNNYGYDCDGNILLDSDITLDVILHESGSYITQSELYDLHGRRVDDKAILPEGIYIVRQYWDNGFITTKKLYLNSWRQ